MSNTKTMPPDLPPLKEGWVYYGRGCLPCPIDSPTKDIACYADDSNGWDCENGYCGGHPEYHYALRAGSEIARKNGIDCDTITTLCRDRRPAGGQWPRMGGQMTC